MYCTFQQVQMIHPIKLTCLMKLNNPILVKGIRFKICQRFYNGNEIMLKDFENFLIIIEIS